MKENCKHILNENPEGIPSVSIYVSGEGFVRVLVDGKDIGPFSKIRVSVGYEGRALRIEREDIYIPSGEAERA